MLFVGGENLIDLVQLDQSPSYYRTLARKLHWASSLTASQPSQN